MIRIPLHVPIEFIRKMEISFEVNFYQSSFFDTFSKKINIWHVFMRP